jgi:hypothetical protein
MGIPYEGQRQQHARIEDHSVSFLISHLVIGRIHAYPVRPLHSYVPVRTDTLTMRKTLTSPCAGQDHA